MSYLSTAIKRARYLITRDTDHVLVIEKNNGSFVDVVLDTTAGRDAAINAAIENLLSGAPAALNTLKELADAVGDDSNFASVILDKIGNQYNVGEWDPSVSYEAKSFVIRNGGLYTSIVSNINEDPLVTTGYWSLSLIETQEDAQRRVDLAAGQLTDDVLAETVSREAGDVDAYQRAIDRTNHTGTQLPSTINGFDSQVRTSRLDQMAKPTAPVDLNGQILTGLPFPLGAYDAVPKSYSDAKIPKPSAPLASPMLLLYDPASQTVSPLDQHYYAYSNEVTAAIQAYVVSLVVTGQTLADLAASSGYVWALTDSSGRAALTVAADGTVAGKITLQDGLLSRTKLDSDLSASVPQQVPSATDYVWAIVDANNRVALQVAADGTVTGKFTVASGSVNLSALDASVSSRLVDPSYSTAFQTVAAPSGYAWAITDQNDRVAFGILSDGTLVGKLQVADASVTEVKLDPALVARFLPSGVTVDTLAPSAGYGFAILDSAGRMAFGVRNDGTLFGTIDTAVVARNAQVAFDPDQYFVDVVGTSPNRQLKSYAISTGQTVVLTTLGDNYDPYITDDGMVLFTQVLPAGSPKRVYTPISGGAIYPVISDIDTFEWWGDSLTQEGSAQARLATLMGITTPPNQGYGSQVSAQIAARQGGSPALMTVAGNNIPGAGPVSVTSQTVMAPGIPAGQVGILYKTGGPAQSLKGWLAGVYGTLLVDDAFNYSFARDVSGSTVPCPPNTPFIVEYSVTYQSKLQIVWPGRNDVSQSRGAVGVTTATDAMIASLKARVKRFIVISTTSATTETSDTVNYSVVKQINDTQAAKYGDRFLDIRRYMIDHALSDLGITPTANDLACIAGDTIPPSVMKSGTGLDGKDTIHFSSAATALIGDQVYARLQQKGWL